MVWLIYKKEENRNKVPENIRRIELVDKQIDKLLIIPENSTKTTNT